MLEIDRKYLLEQWLNLRETKNKQSSAGVTNFKEQFILKTDLHNKPIQ